MNHGRPDHSGAEDARRKYLTAAVMTATPEKLVVLLYDGAIQALARGEAAFDAGRRDVATRSMSKALAIVGELRASLDLEVGGELGQQLFALYGFVSSRIIQANADGAAAPAREAREVLLKLKEGWDGIVHAG